MDKEFNLIAVIRIILKWRKPILILVVISAIASALFSVFVMDEYFLSWATFYPNNQYLSDRSMIFNSEKSDAQVEYFGNKNDVNRVMTIANSAQLMEYITDSFKLADHYKIDKSSKFWKTKVRKEFDKNYAAIKTERDAVEVSIYDTDPKLASDMVRAVVNKIDELNKAPIDASKRNLFALISSQIVEQQKIVNGYVDTLAAIASRYKIKSSFDKQGNIQVEGNDFKATQQYKELMEKNENAVKELNNRINIKEQMEVAMKSNTSSLNLIEAPFAADRREKPVRSLVVLITVLITAFVAITGVLLIEQIKEIKKQL
jgi:capsule polysaccharide export protein KpsE/RkpR